MVRVSAGARLHFGFGNLSLSHGRLYGAFGVALAAPRVAIEATPAESITVDVTSSVSTDVAADVAEYADRARSLLDVDGAALTVETSIPRHAGLGSGTQLALTTLAAIAHAHERDPRVRSRAPALGRGGRSGIGVAAFETGGFILDAGHPTARFTTDRPADGDWTVPALAARHVIPDEWRFLVVCPDADPGRNGTAEDAAMRGAVERASPELADRIAGIVTRRVLPAAAEGRAEAFGAAVAEVGRLNGAWYADEQGGVYRPPVGDVVAALESSPAVFGAGQSSWGPAVYGVTDATHADAAHEAGVEALEAAGVGGPDSIAHGANDGARMEAAGMRMETAGTRMETDDGGGGEVNEDVGDGRNDEQQH